MSAEEPFANRTDPNDKTLPPPVNSRAESQNPAPISSAKSNSDKTSPPAKNPAPSSHTVASGRLLAGLGRPLMVGYTTANGAQKWFAFEDDGRSGNKKSWRQSSRRPSSATEIMFARDDEFLAAFVKEAFAGMPSHHIKNIFKRPVSISEVLFHEQFTGEHSDVSKADRDQITGMLDQEKLAVAPASIITVLESVKHAKKIAAERKLQSQEIAEAQARERAEAMQELTEGRADNEPSQKMEKLAMQSTKVGLGATAALIGASLALSANRNVGGKKESGEPVKWTDRVLQVGAWTATAAAVIYAAYAMWGGKGKKGPSSPGL